VNNLDLVRRYPGYDVVNFAAHVPHANKDQFEAAVRADTSIQAHGYPGFAIRPAGERPEYFVIIYVEPMQGFEFAFGLDLGANPAVQGTDAAALTALQHQARDSGELTASGRPIRIKSKQREYTGLAIRIAVYQSGRPLRTVEERRTAYLGSVGAGIDVDQLMQNIVSAEQAKRLRIQIYDSGVAQGTKPTRIPNEAPMLYDSARNSLSMPQATLEPEEPVHFRQTLALDFGGRNWAIDVSASRSLVLGRTDELLPALLMVGGLLFSASLASVFHFLSRSRRHALVIAQVMTKDLRAAAQRSQCLTRRLVEVQENERKQLARELHDRVGQNLTALSIDLDILGNHMVLGEHASARERINDAALLLESTASAIEDVMTELRPPMLDDYGLRAALQWYAQQFVTRTKITVTVEGDESTCRLAPQSEIALFRIAQEALNNVAKHANAKNVAMTLTRTAHHVELSIQDDGHGSVRETSGTPLRRSGLGMVSMRERCEAIRGTFTFRAVPGTGACVTVKVPH
jgi:signal transduction histidine kinase